MNSFPRLLCLATIASTAAFAQTASSDAAQKAETLVASAASSNTPDLQTRPVSEHALLPTATVLRLKLDNAVSTATARPGQQFTGTLTRAIEVDGRTIVPSGATVTCQVKRARGAQRFAGKPSLSIKALSVRTPEGDELNFTASVVDTANPRHLDVDQEGIIRGASPNPMNKIETGSLAGAGAVAGAVILGPEGLLIGAASGTAVAAGHMVIKHRDLTLPAGTELIFELDAPAAISHPEMGGMQ